MAKGFVAIDFKLAQFPKQMILLTIIRPKNGCPSNAATVAFGEENNTTKSLGQSLEKTGIMREEIAFDLRKLMVPMLLDGGNGVDPHGNDVVSMSGGAIVLPGTTAERIHPGANP